MAEKILEIEKVISNGNGIGRMADGKIVMLPFVLPGEVVSYRITRQRRDYADAVPLAILSPSPHRVDPRCPHFEKCGGCDFQHVAYELQLAIKKDLIQEQLSRPLASRGIDLSGIWQGISRSPDEFGYRQRVRLHSNGRGGLGFFRIASNELEQVSGCPLARAEVDGLIPLLRNSRKAQRLLEISAELEIISSIGDHRILLIFHTRRKPRAGDLASAKGLISEFTQVKSIVLDTDGAERLIVCEEGIDRDIAASVILPFSPAGHQTGPYELICEAGGFSQVNHGLNQLLVAALINWVKESGASKVLDMYCGMGNFSLPLAMLGYQVSGFDQQRSSVRSAGKNSARYGLACDFFRASSAEGLEILKEKGGKFDLLIIDPPRTGCKEAIPAIIDGDCRWIIYVSCDPATLCRDLDSLMEHGFRPEKAAGFDMFPQTRHLETMIMLRRQD